MVLVHFLFALGTAVILSLIFVLGFGRRRGWSFVFIFFILILLASWAGGVWITPIGPPLWEAYWLPFLVAGLIFALVLAAVAAPPPRRSSVELPEPAKEEVDKKAAYWIMGIFFWPLIVVLIVAIVWGYL